jgi:DNA-binding NarL/FixJ family response regulator
MCGVPAALSGGWRAHRVMCSEGEQMLSSVSEDSWITDEERAVLTASARGLNVREVADQLGAEPDAVRQSIASASAKLGARSKLEAVIIALRRGLITLLFV